MSETILSFVDDLSDNREFACTGLRWEETGHGLRPVEMATT